MALDAAFLRHIKNEIEQKAIGAKVDKIYQPMKDVIILSLRTFDGALRLLFSAQANSARVHFAARVPENPKQPPMLCMLFRKKLIGARLASIEQPGLERILHFRFDATDELGDKVVLTLTAEIMGKYSNIILTDAMGKIIDSVKRVDAQMTTRRLVLPGITYALPPAQSKLDILECTVPDVVSAMKNLPGNTELSKAALHTLQGLSPIVCRELCHKTGRGAELHIGDMDEEMWMRFGFFCQKLKETVTAISGTAHMAIDKNNKYLDFSFENILQYGTGAVIYELSSFSELLDRFFFERDEAERIRVRESDILKQLSNLSQRLERKIVTLEAELEACMQCEKLRINGDILTANAYSLKKGDTKVRLSNYYSETGEEIEILLDPRLTPMQNAQRYYKDYRKAKTAQEKLRQQIELAREEIEYIDSLFDCLTRASTEQDLLEIKAELAAQGYVKYKSSGKKREKEPKVSSPLSFTTESGFTVLVGKNNRQNDILTLKTASGNDIWFHTKNIPGSHTVLLTQGGNPDEKAMEEAAILAARHSRARESAQVPVDYTLVRHVKKPRGSKPGMVIYTNQKTLIVNPKEDITFGERKA